MDKENASISLGDIFRVIKKNILLIILIIALCTTLGAVYAFKFTTPLYTSTSSIVVQVPIGSHQSNEDYDINASLKYVDTVKDMILENKLLGPVAEEYHMQYYSLKAKVSVSNEEYSSLIRIRVEDQSSERAQLLANDIAARIVYEADPNNDNGLFFFAKGFIKKSGDALPGVYSSPNKTLLVMCSILIGCVISFAAVFIKEFMSKKFKTKEDVEAYLSDKIISTFANNKRLSPAKNGKKKNGKVKYEYLFDLIEPTIRDMEPYNKLLTNIIYSNIDNPYKVIMITSTTMNELKSTTVSNLAYCMVNNKKKALLIDLDLRLSTLHKFYKVPKENGIVEYLDGSISLEDCIKHTEQGVDIITAGKAVINPVVILESKRLLSLIEKLRDQYDYILIDTPPVSVCTDALIAAKLTDGVIYNISINQANKSLIKECINSLKDVNASIVGLNLTKMEEVKISDYYSYYYSEYNKEIIDREQEAKKEE